MLLLLVLLAAMAVAAPSTVCQYNLDNHYFIVSGQAGGLIPHSQYSTVCGVHGWRPANITADIIPDLLEVLEQCWPLLPSNFPGLWIGTFEALPTPYVCNSLYHEGSVTSSIYECSNITLLALCEAIPIVTIPSILTELATTTEDVTSFLTTTLVYSTETVTDYIVSRITLLITVGTSTLTTITTTSTSCRTLTHTYTSTCRHQHRHDYSSEVDDWKNAKLAKVPAVPGEAQQDYIRCNASLNKFYLVRHNPILKDHTSAQINATEACAYFGYSLANITNPILENIQPLFVDCNLPTGTGIVFNSYYGWTPNCGFLAIGPRGGMGMNNVDDYICDLVGWALCRDGPPVVTTSIVPTGPFETVTIASVVTTETDFVTETTEVTETVTESETQTVTTTSILPLNINIRTTVPTTTVTRTTTKVTSCCCNPVVCTTVEECCKPKPTCHKPGCHRRPHGHHHH